MRHINIIAIKNLIISEKTKEKEKLSESPADITAPAELPQASSLVDFD